MIPVKELVSHVTWYDVTRWHVTWCRTTVISWNSTGLMLYSIPGGLRKHSNCIACKLTFGWLYILTTYSGSHRISSTINLFIRYYNYLQVLQIMMKEHHNYALFIRVQPLWRPQSFLNILMQLCKRAQSDREDLNRAKISDI